ncbi:YchJ family protein [Dietzia aurantiaca]|uniref:YchJ family protein n=1 Tax=Dietzia aurantiaca TaxID=983873 RepID=A0ABV9PWE9_9ACTN
MTPCPCGGADYRDCCGPLVEDGVPARTAEQLMRSRYTAFSLERPDHLWRTWHPRTRPDTVEVGGTTWTGLTVLEVVAGLADDDDGVVEFEARFTDVDGPGIMRERSVFRRRGGRWVYLDSA